MATFQVHTPETAPTDAQDVLAKTTKAYGRVPNLLGVMAEAPASAEAYLALSKLAMQTSFSPEERHVVWFTLNAYHDCRYCMAAHTGIAKHEKINPDVIETARQVGSYEDARLETLRRFTLSMAENRGWVSDGDVDAFLSAGFTKRNVLEIVTLIAHKVLSNYTNHLAETPLDDAFAGFAWQPASEAQTT